MPKYLIERNIPGAGSLDRDELRAASQNSCGVLRDLGPQIQWVHSYVTDDKITCVYISPSEEMIREHARRTGLPADAIMEIRTIIDPTTAEPSRKASTAGAVRSLAALVLAGALALGSMACNSDPGQLLEPTTNDTMATPVAATPVEVELAGDLAALRRVVAPYHRFEAAQEDGYTLLVPHCRDNQPQGGMGWHYANPAYLDGAVEVTKPEALIYEPQEDGSLRFVGVEYVVPFSILPPEAEAPELFGETFLHNFGDELWMLHVWVGRHNPNGMFATWNPQVSCRDAS
jgi:hypothetical protein